MKQLEDGATWSWVLTLKLSKCKVKFLSVGNQRWLFDQGRQHDDTASVN